MAFASALVDGDFSRASQLLAPDLRTELSPEKLRDHLFAMFKGYSEGQPTGIQFDEQFTMTEWPTKQTHDLGCVYVSIEGEDFVEAVTVVVANVDGEPLIREIEWGRP